MQKTNGVLDNLGGCLGTLGVSAIFFLIGAGLAWWGWSILQTARASASWPTAAGLITFAEVEYSTDSDGSDSYTPHVLYDYSVNGQSYQNNTIKFGETTYSSRGTANGVLSRYPVGSAVTVYYEPADPANSVLEAGVSAGSYIVLSIGLIFGLVSFLPPTLAVVRLVFGGRS